MRNGRIERVSVEEIEGKREVRRIWAREMAEEERRGGRK